MKVIMIGSHQRVTGGITRVIQNYLQAGLGQKVKLEFFPTYYGSSHLVNVIYFIIQYFKLLFKLNVLNIKYDVAHIHMSYRGSFLRKRCIIQLLKKKDISIVLHMHGSQFKDFYNESSDSKRKQITETLNSVTIIIALGEQWKAYYQTICNTKVVSLDNAVFPKQAEASDKDKILISTMGVLSKRKGTFDMIEVANRLNNRIDRKYKFLLAGDGEIESVKEKIKRLKLEDRVIVPGWISDQNKIEEIYKNSVIYILPSYNEGMPMSILEAMSYGLPVISTNVGSIPSVIENGKEGFLLEPGDTEGFADKIEHLLNKADLRKSMQNGNIAKIKKQYNVYSNLEELLVLYRQAIESSKVN